MESPEESEVIDRGDLSRCRRVQAQAGRRVGRRHRDAVRSAPDGHADPHPCASHHGRDPRRREAATRDRDRGPLSDQQAGRGIPGISDEARANPPERSPPDGNRPAPEGTARADARQVALGSLLCLRLPSRASAGDRCLADSLWISHLPTVPVPLLAGRRRRETGPATGSDDSLRSTCDFGWMIDYTQAPRMAPSPRNKPPGSTSHLRAAGLRP